jgi:hypothetical protein
MAVFGTKITFHWTNLKLNKFLTRAQGHRQDFERVKDFFFVVDSQSISKIFPKRVAPTNPLATPMEGIEFFEIRHGKG